MVKVKDYELPGEYYYTKEHTWARVEEDGTVTIGLDDFGVKAAGEFEFIDLPMAGDEFTAGEAFGTLESAKWVGKLPMPVSGKVKEVNEDIQYDIEMLKEEPYGVGWLIKVEPSNLEEDLKSPNLYHGDKAVREWLERDIEEKGL